MPIGFDRSHPIMLLVELVTLLLVEVVVVTIWEITRVNCAERVMAPPVPLAPVTVTEYVPVTEPAVIVSVLVKGG